MKTVTLKAIFRNARQPRLHRREFRELCRICKALANGKGVNFRGIA